MNRPTRYYSKQQEKKVAKRLDGKRQANSGVNYKEVCAEYGISQCWAYKIKRGEHWAFNDT